MKILIFCNNELCAQIVFELIRMRMFAGIVIPKTNTELIEDISDSGYVEDKQIYIPSLDDDHELNDIVEDVNPDICFTLTFPSIFKISLLKIPRMGFYNFHFGILPEYRSADPIFWQIRNREHEAGLTVHKMNSEIDAGPILFQEKFPFMSVDTYGSLLYKSVAFSISKLKDIIDLIKQNNISLKMQNQKNAKYYPKPKIKDVCLDWRDMELPEIIATINATNPWNKGAITVINGEEIRILQATPAKFEETLPDQPGLIYHADEKQGVFVVCKNQKLLRIDAIYSALGFAFGGRLLHHGLMKGNVFESKRHSHD